MDNIPTPPRPGNMMNPDLDRFRSPENKVVKPIEPTTNNTEINKNLGDELKALRTYEGDVADVLNRRKTSTISIALAESRKNLGQESIGSSEEDTPKNTSQIPEDKHTGTKLLIISLSILFLGGGIFGAYYLYSKSPIAPAPNVVEVEESEITLIPLDERISIEIKSISKIGLITPMITELGREQKPNTIKEVAPVILETPDCEGEKNCPKPFYRKITLEEMQKATTVSPPDILMRSLTADWVSGIYSNENGERSAFIVLSSNFFQNTFAGMLQWEKVMADDLKLYVTSETIVRGSFVDRLIKNKDVREYRDEYGKALFYYSFIDNNKLLIASDTGLLTEIMNRLEKRSFVR